MFARRIACASFRARFQGGWTHGDLAEATGLALVITQREGPVWSIVSGIGPTHKEHHHGHEEIAENRQARKGRIA